MELEELNNGIKENEIDGVNDINNINILCERCGKKINTLNKRRKWCYSCRKTIINEREKEKKKLLRRLQLI